MDIKEYIGIDNRVYVLWDDGYLHVFETLDDYEDSNIEPIEVIEPECWKRRKVEHGNARSI